MSDRTARMRWLSPSLLPGAEVALGQPRKRYSEQEIAAAVLAVKANNGYIKPVADKMGLNHETLGRWVRGQRRGSGAANRAVMVHKQEQELIAGFLELAGVATKQALANIGEAKSRDASIVAGIAYDKYLLGTGRPTSRTEQLRARYVEPEALRKISSTAVIETTAKALPEPA